MMLPVLFKFLLFWTAGIFVWVTIPQQEREGLIHFISRLVLPRRQMWCSKQGANLNLIGVDDVDVSADFTRTLNTRKRNNKV